VAAALLDLGLNQRHRAGVHLRTFLNRSECLAWPTKA
jgi:hypothetical protein